MTHSRRAIVALAMAAIMLLSVAAMPALAEAPSVSDGTDTGAPSSASSDLTDGDTITYNSSTNSTLTYQADSNNSAVTILQNGTELSSFENGTADELDYLGSDDNGDNYVNLTLPDDETGYEGIVADAGETAELTYRIQNDSTLSNPDTTNVTVNWANDGNKSFTRYDGDHVETAELGLVPSFTSSIPLVGTNYSDIGPAQADREEIGVNGDDQDSITVHVADSDAQDALEQTHSLSEDTGTSWMGHASVSGDAVPVLQSGEDGPGWLDTDEGAYLTVNEGGDEVVVENAGDLLGSDAEDTDLSVTANEAAGLTYAWSLAGNYDAGVLDRVASASAAGPDVNLDPSFEDD